MRRPLVVIAGMGETGVLTAVHLKDCDVVGVTTKLALVSGQELGLRLTSPKAWKKDYLIGLNRFKRLKHVKILPGRAISVEAEAKRLFVELADGSLHIQPYDYLVIATGITNGFWRDDKVSDLAILNSDIKKHSSQLAKADTVAIVGGGPTGTSVAANLAIKYKNKHIHLFHSGDLPLPGYPESVRSEISQLLADVGVHRWPHHRAEPEAQERAATLGGGTVRWQTGQPPFAADAILWATGATRPNSSFLPSEVLNEKGFVLTEPTLQVIGRSDIFAIGDVAQTDENRSSARNWAYRIVANNISALNAGHPEQMKQFEAPRYRWGSIIGAQRDGLTIYLPTGGKYRISRWYVKLILFPIKVRKEIYGGVSSQVWGSARLKASSLMRKRLNIGK